MARPGLSAVSLLLLAAAPFAAPAQQPGAPPVVPDLAEPGADASPDRQAPPFRPNRQPQAQPSDAMPMRTIESAEDAPRYVIAPVLTVDQERLFAESAWGQRAQRQVEAAGQKISDDNERLAAQLSAEEAQLTERRATLDAAEFRRLAEAFDARATAVRRERAQAVTDLNARADADRTAFYKAALPIMGDMMQQRGAVAVLDRRTVFVSLDAIDITPDLITRLDETLGDGADLPTAVLAPDTDTGRPAPDAPQDDTPAAGD
ncbi:OmpH family outer membrane protein [Paracoccus stylophorae]|uniref:OmpH family outer membrane protein n=1 Tax=Paracoccus stylophorae TaxID=659350 RepID=A0ABY7SZA7_9RHOB|nr:OmpH family outer membrane protein [Paracoccus stylophorae]WCR12208.1 OmpH family outer membrane protein [Paracoccus stylophorae]